MEPLWSPVVAIGGNRRQIGSAQTVPKQAKTFAVGCDRLPETFHGKEGVDGSSTSEGSAKAPQAGIAIDHAQTFAESRQQADDARRAARAQASLTDIAGSILRERDVLKVMAALASEARELVTARLVGIGVAEELTQTIRFPVAVGDGAEELRDRQAPLDDVISGAVLRAGEAMRLDRADGEWRGPGLRPIVPCRSQLIVPVIAGEETLAVVLGGGPARGRRALPAGQ